MECQTKMTFVFGSAILALGGLASSPCRPNRMIGMKGKDRTGGSAHWAASKMSLSRIGISGSPMESNGLTRSLTRSGSISGRYSRDINEKPALRLALFLQAVVFPHVLEALVVVLDYEAVYLALLKLMHLVVVHEILVVGIGPPWIEIGNAPDDGGIIPQGE